MKLVLADTASGYNLSPLNNNFQLIQAELQDRVLYRDNPDGEPNHMENALDMNSNPILNIYTDLNDSNSLIHLGDADARYVNTSGDSMGGDLSMNGYSLTIKVPTKPNEPVRKDQLDATVVNYQSADANLQAQISDTVPLEASAFSPVSWHDQVILNSVTIPDNKNAWSFGPVMTISAGQVVEIGSGSHWTIAEGTAVDSYGNQVIDEGTL